MTNAINPTMSSAAGVGLLVVATARQNMGRAPQAARRR
jgi:hypothetical protein